VQGNPLRALIDDWFTSRDLRPLVLGEFADSALLKTFGRAGRGLFPAPANMQAEMAAQFDAVAIGTLHGVTESWYAITTQRRIQHPGIAVVQAAGHERLAL